MKLLTVFFLVFSSLVQAAEPEYPPNNCPVGPTKVRFYRRCTIQMITYFTNKRIQIANEKVQEQCGCAAKNFPVEGGATNAECDYVSTEAMVSFMDSDMIMLKCRM